MNALSQKIMASVEAKLGKGKATKDINSGFSILDENELQDKRAPASSKEAHAYEPE